MAAESPRTWTLTADASGAARWGNPRIGGVNPPLIEAREKINVVELDWVLDLLEAALLRPDRTDHPEDAACDCDECRDNRAAYALLREHGRLGGSDGSQC